MTAAERYEEILKLYGQLNAKLPEYRSVFGDAGKGCKAPSCKCELWAALSLHALAAFLMLVIFNTLGKDNTACIVLIISMSVLWVVSLFVSLSVVSRIYAAKMEQHRLNVERRRKDEDAHKSRLFKYLDEALAACWEETAPKKEDPNKGKANQSQPSQGNK